MKIMSKRRQARIERALSKSRRYKKLIYNRIIVTAFLFLMQIAFSVTLLLTFYNKAIKISLILFKILAGICVLYILNKYEKPSDKLSWVIIILVFPFFGVSAYLIFGNGRPTKKLRKKLEETKKQNLASFHQSPRITKQSGSSGGRAAQICNYLRDYDGYPAFTDGDVTYYECGEKMFPEMMKEIRSAKKYILLEYFIVANGKMWNELRSALLEKASEGVQIRFIFDDFGCILNLPPNYEKYLESLSPNIKCHAFNPVHPIFSMQINNRSHRKYVVVDGRVAFTGGINIADEYINESSRFGYWKDSGVKVTGGAVGSFCLMFFNTWNAVRKDREDFVAYLSAASETPEKKDENKKEAFIQPYDDSPLDNESVGETVYLDLINRAKKYVYVFTPYLIADDFIRRALCAAAKRGVDVRIVVPGIPDKKMIYRMTRANYPPLLNAGVKIYEYTPGFIHAKSFVTDDNSAVVGTINIDYRSLYLHFENAVYFTNEDAVLSVKRDCEQTFAISRLVTRSDVKRTIFGRLVDSVLRVFETVV